jgi:hypothetical protein
MSGVHSLHLRGRGRVVVHLHGSGHVTLKRGRFDDFCFEGRGLPRHVSADCVRLAGATGTLVVEGDSLDLLFEGGHADVEYAGVFDLDRPSAQPHPGPAEQAG